MLNREFSKVHIDTLKRLGIHSYTVDLMSGFILYRSVSGEARVNHLPAFGKQRKSPVCADKETIEETIRNNDTCKLDRRKFWEQLARLGVRYYDVLLKDAMPTVIYVTEEDVLLKQPA